MYKMAVLMCITSLLLFGCSNGADKKAISSSIYKDSKNVYQILVDYMQNGKEIDGGKQRQIDSYASKTHREIDSYNDLEKSLAQLVVEMNSYRTNYDILKNSSDKLIQMDGFNKNADEVKKIFDYIGK